MAQQFPKDRFDVVPPDLERVGAHRAPRRRGQGLLWLVWCLVAILVIVGAGWVYLRVLDQSLFGSSPPPKPPATSSGTPSASASETPTPTPTPTPTATLVPSTSIDVLNGAGTRGLAAGAASKLRAAGWTTVQAANASQTGVTTTTVYYADPSLQGVALGVAQALGTTTVAQSDQFATSGAQITVVLGTDFSG